MKILSIITEDKFQDGQTRRQKLNKLFNDRARLKDNWRQAKEEGNSEKASELADMLGAIDDKIDALQEHAVFMPKTQSEFDAANLLDLKHNRKELIRAIEDAFHDGDDEYAAELKKELAEINRELGINESVLSEADKTAIKERLKKLKADQKELPQNPSNQAGYDALDDLRAEIKSLEKQLSEAHGGRSAANEQYINTQGEIAAMLTQLNEKLKSHTSAQQKDPTNWGYVGDLDSLMALLKEALDNFGNV